jgi:hypothetical protein
VVQPGNWDDMSPSQIAEAQKLAREWNVRMSARQS